MLANSSVFQAQSAQSHAIGASESGKKLAKSRLYATRLNSRQMCVSIIAFKNLEFFFLNLDFQDLNYFTSLFEEQKLKSESKV